MDYAAHIAAQQARVDTALRAPLHACTANACTQGHKACPTPDACLLPAGDDPQDIADLYWALFAVALLAVPVLAAVYFIADNWPVLVSIWRT
jgi:hypothetical protein